LSAEAVSSFRSADDFDWWSGKAENFDNKKLKKNVNQDVDEGERREMSRLDKALDPCDDENDDKDAERAVDLWRIPGRAGTGGWKYSDANVPSWTLRLFALLWIILVQ
jgi:hypothetical protein